MSSFIQYLQVNQNYKNLTQYGGIAPIALSKWWVGIADEDPKSQPQDVFIIDAGGNKQIIQQPFFTDANGNFVDTEDRTATPIFPQINKDSYSLYVELISDGNLAIYQRRNVPAGINTPEYQAKADLKDITVTTDKIDWDINAPSALSTDQRFTTLEDAAITKNTLSDSIISDNSQQGASSNAVLNLKNYFGYNRTDYYQSDITRPRAAETGLIQAIIVNGGQGGQGGTLNVGDKPIQSSGGNSGECLMVWLISEQMPDIINIVVATGSPRTGDEQNKEAQPGNYGGTSSLQFTIEGTDYEISTSSPDDLAQPFVQDFLYIPANTGQAGQITWGKNITDSNKVMARSGAGGASPILKNSRFTQAGGGGKGGASCSDGSVTGQAQNGELGMVILNTFQG